MSKNYEVFLSRLKSIQGERSVSAFARDLGVPQKSLDNYVKGSRKPSVDLILLVCSKCGITSDYLLGLTDEPSPSPIGEDNLWRKRAIESEHKLGKVNEALGKIIEGTKALQEAVK